VSTRNEIVLSATTRRRSPAPRIAHAVSTIPPAPPAENSRVAASPAMHTW
jgi:hypothetical protein